ncbi:hypothetical protein [Streptomyces bottropensis]|uniref:hypothetical protein n=1 Tax=Streptomyces bottropensis TaxID=42235 RepID=UPI00369AC6EA
MTLTNQAPNSSVWIAPVGADPNDAGAWTHVGYTDDATFETDDGPQPFLPDGWPPKATATITVPVRLIRYLLPPTHTVCGWTLRAIEEHARQTRISAVLAEALASPRLPCPLPFPPAAQPTRSYQP